MLGIGETELVIIVVFAFLLFGPDKLPGMGRTLGRVLRQFREASDGFSEVVQTNIMDPASQELEKSPKQRRREEAAKLDADADAEAAEATEETPVRRRETFAERKARLAAERKAAEEAAAAAAAAGAGTADQDAPADAPAAPEPAQAAGDAPAARAVDLYATQARSSRFRAAQESAENEDVTGDKADAADAVASEVVAGSQDEGEGDGNA